MCAGSGVDVFLCIISKGFESPDLKWISTLDGEGTRWPLTSEVSPCWCWGTYGPGEGIGSPGLIPCLLMHYIFQGYLLMPGCFGGDLSCSVKCLLFSLLNEAFHHNWEFTVSIGITALNLPISNRYWSNWNGRAVGFFFSLGSSCVFSLGIANC